MDALGQRSDSYDCCRQTGCSVDDGEPSHFGLGKPRKGRAPPRWSRDSAFLFYEDMVWNGDWEMLLPRYTKIYRVTYLVGENVHLT